METNVVKAIKKLMGNKRCDLFSLQDKVYGLRPEQKQAVFSAVIKEYNHGAIKMSYVLKGMYPEPYEQYGDIDETKNKDMIEFLFNLLEDNEIRKRFLNEFALISCLDPANRAKVYANLDYSSLNQKEKETLIKLLSNYVDIKLPTCILEDAKFVEDVAGIPNSQLYNSIFRTLQVNNSHHLEKIRAKRAETIDLLIDEYMLDSDNFFKHYDGHYVRNFVQLVFERFFGASVNDSLLTANVIIEASNSIFELESELGKTISENGRVVLEEIRAMLLKLMQQNLPTSYVSNNINMDEEMAIHFKKMIENAREIENFSEKYAKLYKLARSVFENRINTEIESLPLKLKNPNGNPNVFEIDYTKPFYMLVHVQEIGDEERISKRIIPEIPDHAHKINVSMSLLNNSHFDRFKSNSFAEEVVFGFTHIAEGSLMHAFMRDSFTQYADKRMSASKFDGIITNYPPTYLDIDSFMAGTQTFNELKIHATANKKNKDSKAVMLPSYILCIDKIQTKELQLSDDLGIPIVYVDTKKLDPNVNLSNGNHKSLIMKYPALFEDRTNPLLI